MKDAEVTGPHAEAADVFASAQEARLWIGNNIMLITDGASGYDDYAGVFDPLLAETLERAPIKAKIEVLREAVRRTNMTLAK